MNEPSPPPSSEAPSRLWIEEAHLPVPARIDRLKPFLSPERLARMEAVLAWRTRFLQVVLEDIYQPHNAAACLRSCDCFGVQEVHVIEKRNNFDPSENVALGAEKWLTLKRWKEQTANPNPTFACLEDFRQRGFRIVVTTLEPPSVPPPEVPLDRPLALVFGTEETGVSTTALEAADTRLHLPMYGFTQSFNISVSCALALQALTARIHGLPAARWELPEAEKQALLADWMFKSIRGARQILQREPRSKAGAPSHL
jgi:tRNA (guanosine-2'-O-)-methyltransferase